jgi:hypothetical protein
MPIAVARLLRYPGETASPMSLIRSLFWFALFLVATFGFTVLFEHGTGNYFENAKKEKEYLLKMVSSAPEKKGDPTEQMLK